jgi:predicted glycoside hydrolase/deacetylase ChbG (UPF0249 family)
MMEIRKCAPAFLGALFIAACLWAAQPLRSQTKSPSPQEQILQSLGADRAVIFNGDDLGRTRWSNEGVAQAFDNGVLTSTSLMTPALARDDAYAIARANPHYDIGVHLILARDDAPGNLYKPLNPADTTTSFIDQNGNFITTIAPLLNADKDQVYAELKAQIEHALANGVDITHLDCHKGWYHDYNPRTLKPVLALAAQHRLPIRWMGRSSDPSLTSKGIVTPDNLVFINGRLPLEDKKQQLVDSLNNLKPGITEFLFHPATGGYTEDEAAMRTSDLKLMLDPDVRAAAGATPLIGFKALRDKMRELDAKR